MHMYMYIPKIELLEHGIDMVFSSQHVTQRGNWYMEEGETAVFMLLTQNMAGRLTLTDSPKKENP